MAAVGHIGCPKFTFDRISGHFRSIRIFCLEIFAKLPPADILDVRILTSYCTVLDFIHHCYLAPGGGCEVLFSPGLSVCLSVCVCVCVCVCVRPIFWYFISQLLEEISF